MLLFSYGMTWWMDFLLLSDMQGLHRSSVYSTYCLSKRWSASLCTLFVKFHFIDNSQTATHLETELFSDPSFLSSKDHPRVTVLRRSAISEPQLPHGVGKTLYSYESKIWAKRSSAKLPHNCWFWFTCSHNYRSWRYNWE